MTSQLVKHNMPHTLLIRRSLCHLFACVFAYCVNGTIVTCCPTVIDYCDPNPCVRGQCVAQDDTFHCECPNGYNGTHCELGKLKTLSRSHDINRRYNIWLYHLIVQHNDSEQSFASLVTGRTYLALSCYLYVWFVSMCLCCIRPNKSYVVVVVIYDYILSLLCIHFIIG